MSASPRRTPSVSLAIFVTVLSVLAAAPRLPVTQHSGISIGVFADFNGDGVTDIGRQRNGEYQVSWGGASGCNKLHDGTYAWPLTSMLVGDFTGDGRADVLHYQFSDFGVGERFVLSRASILPFLVWSRHEMR